MARPCTICQHPRRADIDKALLNRETVTSVAAQFGVSAPALFRHQARHLAELLAQAQIAQDAVERAARETTATRARQAIDVFAELQRAIERVNLLSDACDRWLRDPEQPDRYDVGARAEDVIVIYSPSSQIGKPKKAPLSELLHAVEKYAKIEAVEVKSADPRDLLLKAHATAKGQLELLVSVLDKLHGARQMQAFEAAVLDAIAETAPDVRDRILTSLDASQRLRALTRWDHAAGDGGAGDA